MTEPIIKIVIESLCIFYVGVVKKKSDVLNIVHEHNGNHYKITVERVSDDAVPPNKSLH